MKDDLKSALKFYQKIKDEIDDSYWGGPTLPYKYKTLQETNQFKSAFNELDQIQRQQWFDHQYHQAIRYSLNQETRVKARGILLLILQSHKTFNLKLTKFYEFGPTIYNCWIKPNIKPLYLETKLKQIYQECDFVEKKKKDKIGCGCFKSKSDSCSIF